MAKASVRNDKNCSVARTLEVMGDPWGFLIIRALFFGVHRFNDILDHGVIPKKILAARLKVLLEQGVLTRKTYETRPPRFEYFLTEKGHETYPPAIALMQWGDRWVPDRRGVPVVLRHSSCGHRLQVSVVCSECREPLTIRDVSYRDGPGAGVTSRSATRRHRRSPSPEIYQRGRPCSVARALTIVADRWLFLIMREACFGTRRFDDFHDKTGIARNILADRLNHLVDSGMLVRHLYSERPERFEYRLGEAGKDLYPPIIALLGWGDRWQSGRRGPPLILTHRKCGKTFKPLIVCANCGDPIQSRDVTYREADYVVHRPAMPAG